MTYKSFAIIIVIFLLSINITLLFALKKSKLKCQTYIESIKNSEHEEKLILTFRLFSVTDISGQIRTQILKDNPIFVNEFKDQDKVVAYVPKDGCASCISRLFIDLDILSKVIGKNRVIIATNMNDHGKPLYNSDFDFTHYYIENFFPEIDTYNQPFLFIMNRFFEVKLLFIPDLLPEFRQEYFENTMIDYFQN
jgi:hypothetical protein